MRFAVKDHCGEAFAIARALTRAGHELAQDGPTDLFLVDLDPDLLGHRDLIDFYREQGAVVLQYPHGAPLSTLCYDNIYEPYPGVDGQLTIGWGEIEFLRRIEVRRPARIIGWPYCQQIPFRVSDEPRHVVFAPTHPSAAGTLMDARREANARVYRDLLAGDYEVTVRHIGPLEQGGLWPDDRVYRYVEGGLDLSTAEIDGADAVVAGAGTFPCLAVARGCPTVMYGQFDGAVYATPGEQPVPLRNLSSYRSLVRYPYDAEDGDLRDVLAAAGAARLPRAGLDLWNWRRAWIGDQLAPDHAVRVIERFVDFVRTLARSRAAEGTDRAVPR